MRHTHPYFGLFVVAVFALAAVAVSVRPASAAVCTWNAPAGNWNEPAKWTCAMVPGPGDMAIINNGGVVSVTADVTVGSLNLSNGTLGGSAPMSVTSRFDWIFGTLTSTVPGVPFTLLPSGVMTISGNVTLNGRPFNNHGTTVWVSGYPYLQYGAAFNNSANGTLQVATTGAEYFHTGTTGVLNNAGRIIKTGGGSTSFYTSLNNSGSVTLTAGTMTLIASGTHSGSFAVPAGSAIQFSNGTNVLNPSASLKGAGTAVSTGGTVVISGTYNMSSTQVTLGSVSLSTGQALLMNQLTVGGGSLTLSNGQGVTLNRFTMTGGVLDGSDAVSVTNTFDWSLGILTSTVPGTPFTLLPGGVMTIAGNVSLHGRPLNNYGTAIWAAGHPYLQYGAAFNNPANSTLMFATTANEYWHTGTTGALNNAGRIIKTGSGNSGSYVNVYNSGWVTLTAGTLTLIANGTHSGSFAVPAGTAIQFQGGTNVLNPSASLKGGGSANVNGGTAVINGTYSVSKTVVSAGELSLSNGQGVALYQLTLSGGTLGGTDPLSVTSTFNWSNGTLTSTLGATPFTLLPGGVMTISTVVTLNGRVFNNRGTALWTAGVVNLQNAAVFNNAEGGFLSLAASGGESWYSTTGGVFNNAGTVSRSIAPQLPWYVPFSNTGTVLLTGANMKLFSSYAQTAGSTELVNAALIKTSGSIDLQGGQLRGTGVITAVLSQQGGIVAPGNTPGALKLVGDYVQFPNGQLDIELGGLTSGTQYDLFEVSGSAALSGTLNILLVNGFTPALGNTFRVMNYGSHTGTFSGVLGSNVGSGIALKPIYNPDHILLTVNRLLFLPMIVR